MPTTNRPDAKRRTSNANASSSSPFEEKNNYVPNRKTLGLELVASELLLAKHSQWDLAHSNENGIAITSTSNREEAKAQRQTAVRSKSMTIVATKMTTTLRGFLTSSQELPTKKKLILDSNNNTNHCKGNDGVVTSVPDKVLTPTTTTSTAMTIRRLEANSRDTPSIFANARKSGRKKLHTSRQKDVKFDVSFDENVGEIAADGASTSQQKLGAFDESFGEGVNRDASVKGFIFGKDSDPEKIEVANDVNSFMAEQTFDSAFNSSLDGAAADKSFGENMNLYTITKDLISGKHINQEQVEVTDDDNSYWKGFVRGFNVLGSGDADTAVDPNISGKHINQEQIEVTDDGNFVWKEQTFVGGSNASGSGATATAVNPSDVDLDDVNTTTITSPSKCPLLLTHDRSSASLQCDDVHSLAILSSQLKSPTIVHDARVQKTADARSSKDQNDIETTLASIDSQQQKQPKIAISNSPASVRSGATLSTMNVRDYFCIPIVSSSEIHQLLRTDSFMEYSTGNAMLADGENRNQHLSNDATPILESPTSPSTTMKREFSNESPTGVDELNRSEYHQAAVSESNVVSEGEENAAMIIDHDKDDDIATWNSFDTQKTANTCNTSKVSSRRRRSGSITSQKIRRVHFENDNKEGACDFDRGAELKSESGGCWSACGESITGVQESERSKDDANVHSDKETGDIKSPTDSYELSTAPTSVDLIDGIAKFFEKCFVNNGSSSNGLVQSLAEKKSSPLLQDDPAKGTLVDDQPLKCIHPPKIHRDLKPIDLFQAKDHSDCSVLRNELREESVIEDGKSRVEDINDKYDDDTLETSTVDSLTSKETAASSSVHTYEHVGNSQSGCNPIPLWVDNGFHSVLDVIDTVDNAFNRCTIGCNKNSANDDCSDAPYDEEEHDDIEDDDDDEDDDEELSYRNGRKSWENRNGRRSLHYRSRSRHLRRQARMRNTPSPSNSDVDRPNEVYVSPDRKNELDGRCGSTLLERKQSPKEQISKTLSVDGALDAREEDIAASKAIKFGSNRSYVQKKRRFRIKRAWSSTSNDL